MTTCARGRPGQPTSLLVRVLILKCMADVSELHLQRQQVAVP